MLSDVIVASKPDPIFDDEASSFASKTKEFVHNVRYFRLFIGLWNFVVIALMCTFFGG